MARVKSTRSRRRRFIENKTRQHNKNVCEICKKNWKNKKNYGKLYIYSYSHKKKSPLFVHYVCLLSSELKQNAKLNEGIFGFKFEDIKSFVAELQLSPKEEKTENLKDNCEQNFINDIDSDYAETNNHDETKSDYNHQHDTDSHDDENETDIDYYPDNTDSDDNETDIDNVDRDDVLLLKENASILISLEPKRLNEKPIIIDDPPENKELMLKDNESTLIAEPKIINDKPTIIEDSPLLNDDDDDDEPIIIEVPPIIYTIEDEDAIDDTPEKNTLNKRDDFDEDFDDDIIDANYIPNEDERIYRVRLKAYELKEKKKQRQKRRRVMLKNVTFSLSHENRRQKKRRNKKTNQFIFFNSSCFFLLIKLL